MNLKLVLEKCKNVYSHNTGIPIYVVERTKIETVFLKNIYTSPLVGVWPRSVTFNGLYYTTFGLVLRYLH